ncbi:MAG TPA: TIGR00730 family Rossman fold protein [Ohtaekwangia sp.]|nr:TIGR00730 family Rossman fold protein [Ohtaekwangia sp.]
MNICVFCGSSVGIKSAFADAAKHLGRLMAEKKHTLIYGGGNIGLMGILADAVMEHGGEVVGVIPDFLLQREVGHRGITRLEVVTTMHARKNRMAELSHAFIALPGGWGTLDELAEILTWRQLGLIQHPIAVLNTLQFFNPLLSQMEHMASMGFLRDDYRAHFTVEESAERLLTRFGPQSF